MRREGGSSSSSSSSSSVLVATQIYSSSDTKKYGPYLLYSIAKGYFSSNVPLGIAVSRRLLLLEGQKINRTRALPRAQRMSIFFRKSVTTRGVGVHSTCVEVRTVRTVSLQTFCPSGLGKRRASPLFESFQRLFSASAPLQDNLQTTRLKIRASERS